MERLPGIDAVWPNRSDLVYEQDPDLAAVADWFRAQEDFERRFGLVFRRSFNEVLDGVRTGRYDVAELEKTEKTYIGTKVEIVVRSEFGLEKGRPMDYVIEDRQVDAKFSLSASGWTIPMEAVGHLCLLLHADDRGSRFTVGLIRTTEAVLRGGGNRDSKRGVSKEGKKMIHWLVPDGELPVNRLLHLPENTRDRILAFRSGQQRVNELFRRVQGEIIGRDSVEPVAMQTDVAKRVRDSRLQLWLEGIVILGHQSDHPRIARELALPVPSKGEWISVRLVPDTGDGRPVTIFKGRPSVVAREYEPVQSLPVGTY
ncbi:NaeI family type II restriction endonuclease [Glycomyces harbinensis]|uniref:Restriction endonuclease NaeI n=1 Tax=Glycomyces harbinensis TaxID=58114 RepID=A0A1G7DV68_9ACTN|nr:NaeI family type II restriction endonuclease [Glycomyces harbinensis]SDE55394.1 Restriction endonuclease NaeI [Glycomyces harbinensis]